MNAYQLTQLEPKQIESIIYTNPASTDLEITLSAKLLDLQQYSDDSDQEIERLTEQCDKFESDLDDETARLELKIDETATYLYEIAEICEIYDDEKSDISDSDKLHDIIDKLNHARKENYL